MPIELLTITQQFFLREAMQRLGVTRNEFARLFKFTRRALDAWLLPDESDQHRPMPAYLWTYINQVLFTHGKNFLICTHGVYYSESKFISIDTENMSIPALYPPLMIQFHGTRQAKRVAVKKVLDGVESQLPFYLGVKTINPAGFDWGNANKGTSQLALAMAIELVGVDEAKKCYEQIQKAILEPLSANSWTLSGDEIMSAIENKVE